MGRKIFYRGFFFCLGMLILAFGLTLNTRTGLGATAIIAVAQAASEIWGLSLGDGALGLYTVFVLFELYYHLRKYGFSEKSMLLKDILQIPMSLLFTRIMNVFSAVIPLFETECAGSFAGSYPGRLCFLALAIICTGLGSVLSVNTYLIPSPGDGIMDAAADYYSVSRGLAKNILDFVCILAAVLLSFLCVGRIVGVGIGTVASVIFVGRAVALFDFLFKKNIQRLSGTGTFS